MTGAAIVLQATGLTKTFESDGAPVRALRGVDFAMASGEFVAPRLPRAAASRRCSTWPLGSTH